MDEILAELDAAAGAYEAAAEPLNDPGRTATDEERTAFAEAEKRFKAAQTAAETAQAGAEREAVAVQERETRVASVRTAREVADRFRVNTLRRPNANPARDPSSGKLGRWNVDHMTEAVEAAFECWILAADEVPRPDHARSVRGRGAVGRRSPRGRVRPPALDRETVRDVPPMARRAAGE
jgi:hypothetical protein